MNARAKGVFTVKTVCGVCGVSVLAIMPVCVKHNWKATL
nr:MAG TPA: Ribosome biogenesis protein Nop10, Zinc-Ribbon, RNA BINDING PROTEIN [Caudoviricetes sp.]